MLFGIDVWQINSERCLDFARHDKKALLESPEPGIRKYIARAIGRPTRWIHFPMRLHDRIMIVDLAAALPQITNQFFAAIELHARRLITIEIANQTNAERDVV